LKVGVASSETSLTAVLATKSQAALLHLKAREPLLCMRETHFDEKRKRTFYSVNYHNTAVIDFTLIRMGAQS
jgi:DNA-binding GntR family transcriptional regulator